jgi:hypothetical protein
VPASISSSSGCRRSGSRNRTNIIWHKYVRTARENCGSDAASLIEIVGVVGGNFEGTGAGEQEIDQTAMDGLGNPVEGDRVFVVRNNLEAVAWFQMELPAHDIIYMVS